METVGGIPVECLTGELAGIWSGWRNLGDREVVREASAKGTHINLAQQCLASRRHCSLNDAQTYFHREVDIWVEELLNKQQVFRATHILKNVGKNPKERISSVCIKTKDSKLRDYLVTHLQKINGLDKMQIETWNLLNLMAKYRLKYTIKDDPISHKSIEEIMQIPEDLKLVLYTDLFFNTYEPEISDQLVNEVVWDYLLMKNRVDLLNFWIDLTYGSRETVLESVDKDVVEKLEKVFERLKITGKMIDSIHESEAMSIVKSIVLDRLCRYGVFMTHEKFNVKLVLTRLFNNKIVPRNFLNILTQPCSNIDPQHVLSKLNVEFYSKHYLEENQMKEADMKIHELSVALEAMCGDSMTNDIFENAVISTVGYITDDVQNYLKRQPFLILCLIFSRLESMINNFATGKNNVATEQSFLKSLLSCDNDLSIGNEIVSKEVLRETFCGVPYLKDILLDSKKKRNVSVYQLLNGYKDLNSSRAFSWRQRNVKMPTFSSAYLSQKYGHQEKLTYIHYLKQGRPSMAAQILTYEQKKFHPDISSKMKCQASTNAHIFALRNINFPDITSACVSFIEIIGVNSENLRLHLTIAKRIQDELNISTAELLEAVVHNNNSDLQSLLSYLEQSVELRLNESLEEDANQLLTAIKEWALNVKFARAHNITLPTTLLEYLVRRNLWLEFILVGQIYAYPVEQMLSLARRLPNSNVKDHLLVCLNNSMLMRESVTGLADREQKVRDFRSTNSKIDFAQRETCNSSPPEFGSHVSKLVVDNVSLDDDDDLWMTILKCHRSQDPLSALLKIARIRRSPLLIVLATCYEPSSFASYWCSWLVISTDDSVIISDYQDLIDHQNWSADKVLCLLEKLVAIGHVKTLNRGLRIFMPDNPLSQFTEYLSLCVNLGDFETGRKSLQAFTATCSSLLRSKKMVWTESDVSCINNLYWIALASVRCAVTALAYNFSSTISQFEFLNGLISCNFDTNLPDSPNFHQLLDVMKILLSTESTIDFKRLLAPENYNDALTQEFRRCIVELVQRDNYKAALDLCNVARLDCSDILLAQWRTEFAKSVDESGRSGIRFWKRCSEDFEKYQVNYEAAAEFYVEHAKQVASHKERYEILKLALKTLKGSSSNLSITHWVEMAMWKSRILAGPNDVDEAAADASPMALDKLKTELMSGLTNLQVRCELTEPEEVLGAERLINELIDAGNLHVALRIASIFNCKHRDLQILMLCWSLAEGEISPHQLTTQQRSLFSATTKLKNQRQSTYRGKGLHKLQSISTANSNSSLDTTELASEVSTEVLNDSTMSSLVSEKEDKLACMKLLERLVEILHHGIAAGRKVLLCYRLAIHLGRSYQSLLTLSNPLGFLREIVIDECDHKLELVSDVVAAYQVNRNQLAEFLSENIVATISKHIEGDHNDKPMAMWGYPLDGSFHVITELCNEPSLLGWKLLEAATRLLGRSHGEKREVVVLKISVELLIKSHDCFTASCNMEGIAIILRKSQQLANSLQNLKQWALLVRLLTGVGRFTEMNYILQILKENEQFEFLLTGRGLEKIAGLKTALLEFLRRNCPENKELFHIVALHFRLYSEIAMTWEQEAKATIDKILTDARIESRNLVNLEPGEIRLTKNDNTEKALHLATVNYTHATEYYLQDNKLTLAYQCCHQAELLALQLSFFHGVAQNQHVPSLLKLSSIEVDKMITNELSFYQANVLIRAYNHPVDWGNIIYAHCITQNDAKYLKDFMANNELNMTIIKDCAKRYQLEKSITKQMAENMQLLISHTEDVECKYTLASQLGFKKVIEQMLSSASISAYLKDTVWRKGYSSTAFE